MKSAIPLLINEPVTIYYIVLLSSNALFNFHHTLKVCTLSDFRSAARKSKEEQGRVNRLVRAGRVKETKKKIVLTIEAINTADRRELGPAVQTEKIEA